MTILIKRLVRSKLPGVSMVGAGGWSAALPSGWNISSPTPAAGTMDAAMAGTDHTLLYLGRPDYSGCASYLG